MPAAEGAAEAGAESCIPEPHIPSVPISLIQPSREPPRGPTSLVSITETYLCSSLILDPKIFAGLSHGLCRTPLRLHRINNGEDTRLFRRFGTPDLRFFAPIPLLLRDLRGGGLHRLVFDRFVKNLQQLRFVENHFLAGKSDNVIGVRQFDRIHRTCLLAHAAIDAT